jgi:hypothetical protein
MTEHTQDGFTTYEQDKAGHDSERRAMMTDCRNELLRTFARISQWGGPVYRIPDKLEAWFAECEVKV